MVDVDGVRGLARQVNGLAGEARATAARVAATEGVAWQSLAAQDWRESLRRDAARVGAAAEELDDAVRALYEHADAVERRLAEIEAVRRAFSALVDRARHTLSEAVDDVEDAGTSAARALLSVASRIPSPTSVDWPDFAKGWL